MIYEGKDVPRGRVECQAVVVGSGAGGAVVAKELSESGVDVIMLEAGAFHRPEEDFNQREEDMLPALFYEQGARMSNDLSVTLMHGRGVGGSTVHNTSLSVPPDGAILARWAREHGVEGMSLEDLQPSVDRVYRDLGVNPMRAEEMNPNNAVVKAGADALGWKGFIPHHNRVGCFGAGFCDLGCTYNRKQSMLITYVPKADSNGARIFADCRADQILTEGGRAVGVRATAVDRATGAPLHEVEIRARTVVLSGGAIMTPALMLQSGLPDTSGLLGRTLRIHPSVPVVALFEERIEGWRGIPQTYIIDEFATFYKDGYGGYLIIPVFTQPGSAAVMGPGMGAVHAGLMRNYAHISAAVPLVHDESMGRVRVKRDGRIDVSYWPEGKDQDWLMHGIRKIAEMYFAAGAKEVVLPYAEGVSIRSPKELDIIERRGVRKYELGVASVHPQGTVPMDANPKKGCLDSHCESHDVKNLFVADASVFPTSLGTPPMIPTASIATHISRYMLAERRRYFE
jgi:choline dehydrogenase-like flavoprotein